MLLQWYILLLYLDLFLHMAISHRFPDRASHFPCYHYLGHARVSPLAHQGRT